MEQSGGKHENEAARLWHQNPKGVCIHQNKETVSAGSQSECSILLRDNLSTNQREVFLSRDVA